MASTPLISIIVPTYNSEHNLKRLLNSLRGSEFKDFEVIINDDPRTSDNTTGVLQEYTDLSIRVLKSNTSMATGRLLGASKARTDILLHLDSDMQVHKLLLGECVNLMNSNIDALIIKEVSIGNGYWAKCKCLEKKCYQGVEQLESSRCMTKDIYQRVGGHNPDMVFSEDKDLDLKLRAGGARISRTKYHVLHDEGYLTLLKTLRKKMKYSETANLFANEHPQAYKWQINILNRYVIYLKNIKYMLTNPFLYPGMIFMKTAEFGASGLAMIKARVS